MTLNEIFFTRPPACQTLKIVVITIKLYVLIYYCKVQHATNFVTDLLIVKQALLKMGGVVQFFCIFYIQLTKF
ncbi:MAG: hypothetical protein CL579_09300 [Alteromonadaceae bacterium]|nr:hypothetical protein [Alteromonadaceae bacterium]MBB21086.1 hypothetical protein [Rickettsiales bacterium]